MFFIFLFNLHYLGLNVSLTLTLSSTFHPHCSYWKRVHHHRCGSRTMHHCSCSIFTNQGTSISCPVFLWYFSSYQSFNGFLYLCPIFIFSVVYNIPKFFELQTTCSVSIRSINSSDFHEVKSVLNYLVWIDSWVQVTDRLSWDMSGVRAESIYKVYILANSIGRLLYLNWDKLWVKNH